jgi:hypothetical protein
MNTGRYNATSSYKDAIFMARSEFILQEVHLLSVVNYFQEYNFVLTVHPLFKCSPLKLLQTLIAIPIQG